MAKFYTASPRHPHYGVRINVVLKLKIDYILINTKAWAYFEKNGMDCILKITEASRACLERKNLAMKRRMAVTSNEGIDKAVELGSGTPRTLKLYPSNK